jgi:hypothetical protein
VRVGSEPGPICIPPVLTEPGITRRRFDPILEIWSEIIRSAPAPMATIAITDAIPIMIPSMVRIERILLTRKAREAIFVDCQISISQL